MICKFCREDIPAAGFRDEDYDKARKNLRFPTCLECLRTTGGSKKQRKAAVKQIMRKLHTGDEKKTWMYSNDEQKRTLQFAKRTKQELKLDAMLRAEGLKFEPQYQLGCYWIDIAFPNHKLAVEVDGSVHLTEKQKKHDNKRTHTLKESHHWEVIRFTNIKVDNCLDEVVRSIKMKLACRQKESVLSNTTAIVYVPPKKLEAQDAQ